MPEKKARIGFVGTGAMGQCAHLRNYVQLADRCEVVALAELRDDVRMRVASRYGVGRVYSSAGDMLAKESLDGIVASQPYSRHGVLLAELSKAGVPVFIEKPLSHSIEVGRKLLEHLERTGVSVMVGYHKRSDPATEYAREKIDEFRRTGELGPMRYVRVTMPPGDWISGGFGDIIDGTGEYPPLEHDPLPDDMDEETFREYDSFVNYYIHQVNLMRHLLGEDYRVTYSDPSGVVIAGLSENNISCCMETDPYRTTVDWQESALVCFENGYVKLDLPAPLASNRAGQVEVLSDPGNGAVPAVSSPILPSVHAMKRQAENFISFVKGERPAPCLAQEALKDLEIARECVLMRRRSCR